MAVGNDLRLMSPERISAEKISLGRARTPRYPELLRRRGGMVAATRKLGGRIQCAPERKRSGWKGACLSCAMDAGRDIYRRAYRFGQRAGLYRIRWSARNVTCGTLSCPLERAKCHARGKMRVFPPLSLFSETAGDALNIFMMHYGSVRDHA